MVLAWLLFTVTDYSKYLFDNVGEFHISIEAGPWKQSTWATLSLRCSTLMGIFDPEAKGGSSGRWKGVTGKVSMKLQ